MSVTDAIRERDDWPDIQMQYANGQSISSLATAIGVHKEQLRRALHAKKIEKVVEAKKRIRAVARETQAKVQEAINEKVTEQTQEVAGSVTENLPATRGSRVLGEFSIDDTIREMRENQAALQEIADNHSQKSPYTAIAAINAANAAAGMILKAMVQYQVHSEKDITKHPAFNRMMVLIMQTLAPFPEAAAALVAALEAPEI